MVLGNLLSLASPLVGLLSAALGANKVFDWNSVVRDTIGHLTRWTPVAYVRESAQTYNFWHTNLNIVGAPPAFPGEQYAYDRMIPPTPENGAVAPTSAAVRQAEQSTRGRINTPDQSGDCPKAIINDNIPALLVVVVVVLRGQEALAPPADPQWQTFPINSTGANAPFPNYYNGSDSPVWSGEQQLLDAKVVYTWGWSSKYKFMGGYESGDWPATRTSNMPNGTIIHVVYRGSDNLILPDQPKLVNRVLGYVVGQCSWQPITNPGNPDAPTDFSQRQ